MVDRLRELAQDRDQVSFDQLVQTMGQQGNAPLLMVCALLMISPIGMIPGVGGALGVVVAIVGFQILMRQTRIDLPHFIGKRCIPARHIRKTADKIHPAADFLRRFLHVRLTSLAEGRASLSVVAVILMLGGGSLLVLGAIPVATPLIGLPVAVYAFGIIARDGAVVAGGHVLVVLVTAGIWYFRAQTGG
ncbi:exopolysaccharide biosynthesis protein [Allosediminivita pacifica]|nr:exopolysaccharide biosynthesis protein [Allosediminivita pacifica]